MCYVLYDKHIIGGQAASSKVVGTYVLSRSHVAAVANETRL